MFKHFLCFGLLLAVSISRADDPKCAPIEREIFVPFADLHVILAGDAQRVFMTREEYDTLGAKAKQALKPAELRQSAAILSAEYSATIEDNRARFVGTLTVVAPDESLSAVELDLSGVALRSATLGDKPASLGRNPAGLPVLFVSGAGRHTLRLEIVAPIETATAQRMLTFQIPTPPATKLTLTVAGNVEIKSGAAIIKRMFDEAGPKTVFDLLPRRGPNSLVLSLNNRQLQKDRVVVAHAVLVDEVNEAFERLHATMSLTVLHGVADQFRFEVPKGFEVLSVTAPQVARWAVSEEGEQRVLDVRLHEPTTETVSLNMVAARTPAPLEDWHLPKLVALDVAGQATVVGLLVESRLKPQNLRPTNLISIDASVLAQTMPASCQERADDPSGEIALAAFYAPHSDYDLEATFKVLPSDLQTTTGVFVSLSNKQIETRGSFTLLNATDKLLDFSFVTPAGWQVAEVTQEAGVAIPFENYAADEGQTRVRVRLPKASAIGQSQTVYFRAVSTPPDWLDAWQSKKLTLPRFQVIGAARDVGAIAVQALDDMRARADETDRLTPLDANEKSKYGLADVTTEMAFRYDAPPYSLTYNVTRQAPRLSARTFSFFRVDQDLLAVHDEIIYDVSEARTSQLTFALPLDTPTEVDIRGLDNVAIKEATSEEVEKERHWTVRLAEPRIGTVRLAIDFQQPLSAKQTTEWILPIVRALEVAYQTGTIAVEGSVEEETQVKTKLRKVDVGELAEADYQPGKRLLGAYGYGGDTADVKVVVDRPSGYDLPTVLVERAELVTAVSSSGKAQTAARFQLRAKAQLIELQLPGNSTLWSVHLDGKPVLPQRESESLLIGLPASSEAVRRDLQLVYETPVAGLGLTGGLDLSAPRLLLRADRGQPGDEVPLADLLWRLTLPGGYQVVRSNGTVFTEDIATRESPVRVAVRAVMEHSPFGDSRYRYAASSSSKVEDIAGHTVHDVYVGPSPAAQATSELAVEKAAESVEEAGEAVKDAAEVAQDESATMDQLSEETPKANEDPFAQPQAPPDAVEMDAEANAPPTPSIEPPMDAPHEPSNGAALPGGYYLNDDVVYTPVKPQWALEGLRSLPIELQTEGLQTAFQSLGEAPRLCVTVVDRHRFDLLAWAVALIVFAFGVCKTTHRVRYVGVVLVASLVLPLALPWFEPLAPVCDMAFFATCWLFAYYLVVAVAKKLWQLGGKIRGRVASPHSIAAAILTGCLFLIQTVHAEDPPLPPVKVPADAIIVPYDATTEDPVKLLNPLDKEDGEQLKPSPFGLGKERKILVPYGHFLDLKKATDPRERPTAIPPVEFAFAGANYSATLDGGESLVIEGQLEMDVFVEHPVNVPIELVGGVLTKINVDGQDKSASIGLAPLPASVPAPESQQPAQQAEVKPQPPEPALALVLTGRGRHKIDLALRFRLQRRGGWRIAEGRLPVAPASALALTVVKGSTELMLSGGPDRGTFETKADGEIIDTALSADGAFRLQWRPKLGRAPLDQSLAATAAAVFDVQEDGLRLLWKFELAFRRDQRESFTVELPTDYLVEKVIGANVRAWRVTEAAAEPKLEVTLLEAAQESESFSVVLAKRGEVGAGELAKFNAPVLNIAGASQQSGQFAVRRSPLIELRTESVKGATRSDSAAAAADSTESPLGISPYQSYRFANTPFTIELVAKPVVARVVAELQTVLKVAERQRTLESRIRLRVQDRPIFRLRVAIPSDWKLDRVSAPDPFQWVESTEGERRLVNFYFAGGQRQPFDIILVGPLGDYGTVKSLDLPQLEVLEADEQTDALEQSGEIVVQADPALSVRAEKLVDCETELLSVANMWLAPTQQSLARLAIRHRSSKYSGTIQLSHRKPIVHCDTVTNVRVTDRIVEETILLNFNIQKAGVREVVFLLPAAMRDARISAPLLRQKTIEPLQEAADAWVRVRLALQEEVLNDFRVLVENDRLLTSEKFSSPIPQVETGQTDHRYVTLESAGRDEILVAESEGVDPLGQEQAEWRMLTELLGRGLTQAYLVKPAANQPRLVLRAQDRAAVETAGARIGLAKTTLIIDPNGAYRGEQLYRVDNSLEQYLEIQLPDGARLWTAHVAGEPVKPAAGKQLGVVRIPLVKTAAGDADYAVVLKYGGQLGSLGTIDRLQFPFIRTLNINVELSQVELHVPATHEWFNFGGTMRVVSSEGDLTAGQVAYNTKQIGLALEAIRSKDSYTRARASNNLKQLRMESEALKQSAQSYRDNPELNKQLESNYQKIESVAKESGLIEGQNDDTEVLDNRSKLNSFFVEQSNGRANDIVQQAGQNFDVQIKPTPPNAADDEAQGQTLNEAWLFKNKLEGDRKPKSTAVAPAKTPALATPVQPNPQADFGKLAAPGKDMQQKGDQRESSGKKQQRTLERYQQRLDEQQVQQHMQLPQRGGRANQSGVMDESRPTGGAQQELTTELFDGRASGPHSGSGQVPGTSPSNIPAAAHEPPKPTALASLDVDLQPRGIKYLLTTPRGDIQVSAQVVSMSLVGRIVRLLVIAVVVGIILAVTRYKRYWFKNNLFTRKSAA